MIPICKIDKQQGTSMEHREIYSNLVITIMRVYLLSHFQLFVTRWIIAHQALSSIGFPRQEYWNELPFPSPGDLPDPGMETRFLTLQADSLPSEPPGKAIYI